MRLRALLFLLVAFVLAGLTVHMVHQRLAQVSSLAAAVATHAAPKTYVLVAAHDLGPGTLLASSDWRWQSWPDGAVDESWLRQGRDDPAMLAGAVVQTGIAAGAPIGTSMVIKPGERGFLAAVLAPGMDAVSIPISPVSAAGGLILPGDRVDLILDHTVSDPSDPAAAPRLVGETVLVNMRVVAIDQALSDDDKKVLDGRTVTLEVTPRQAETVEVAKQLGTLSLALRSAGAGDPAQASEVGMHTWDSDVSPLINRAPPAHGGSHGGSVEVVRGSDVSSGGGDGDGTATSAASAPGSEVHGTTPAALVNNRQKPGGNASGT